MSNIRVIELRQDLALQLEPGVHPDGERSAVHNFDGDLLLELGIGPFSQVNLSHTAGTQGAQYPVRSYAVSDHFCSMHPDKGDPQTMAPLRAGTGYVYESWAPKGHTFRRSTLCQTDTTPIRHHRRRPPLPQAPAVPKPQGRRQAPADSIALIG